MKRKVNKVFKALSKKGMTRAFVEAGKREFVYPVISLNYKKQRGVRNVYIYALAVVVPAAAAVVLLNLEKKNGVDERVSRVLPAEVKSIDGMTGLHHAVVRRDSVSVRALAEKGVNIDARDAYGWTALHWAVFLEDESMCRLMLELDASSSIKSSRRWFKYPAGLTAADIATIKKNLSIKTLLTEHDGKPSLSEEKKVNDTKKKTK